MFSRVVVDKEVIEELAFSKCSQCGSDHIRKQWHTKGKGMSPDLVGTCNDCGLEKKVQMSKQQWKGNARVSLTYFLFMCSILLSGSTWIKASGMVTLMDLPSPSKTFFYGTVSDNVGTAVESVTKDFIYQCRKKIADINDLFVVIDAGWSHAGWWARECTVTAVDGFTGLPIAYCHVIRGENYTGSSRGMEGFGVKKIMKELKEAGFKVTRLLHDKDSSTLNQTLEIFQDVHESLCLSKFFSLFLFIVH